MLLADIKKNVIEMEVTDYTIESMRELDSQLKQVLLPKE
jgi:hypothetical protein